MTDAEKETLEALLLRWDDQATAWERSKTTRELAVDCRAQAAAIRSLLAEVEECERDHPPEPEYLAWIKAGKPDGAEVEQLRAEVEQCDGHGYLREEIARLEAELSQVNTACDYEQRERRAAEAHIEAALAIEPFHPWQDCKGLVVSHAELVKALEGGSDV